jgi:molybdopterin-guanine dinucleotide biosynthesis protein A
VQDPVADGAGPTRVIAAIIAGGQGRRMGGPTTNKGALLVAGRSILDRQLELLTPRFSRILLITNQDVMARSALVTVVKDRVAPGLGPLAGIDAALSALLPDERAVVCLGGDMPLLSGALLDLLRDTEPAAEALVPRVRGHAEPLLARYTRACAPTIAAALASGALKAADVLERLATRWLDEPRLRAVDPTLASFENANTPDDLQRIDRLARNQPP